MKSDYEKVYAIILSCQTFGQITVANRVLNSLFKKDWGKNWKALSINHNYSNKEMVNKHSVLRALFDYKRQSIKHDSLSGSDLFNDWSPPKQLIYNRK